MSVTPYNLSDVVRAMPIATRINVTTEGDTIDRADTNGGVMFAVIAGTVTDGTHVVTIKDSDDGVTFTPAPLFTQGAISWQAANSNQVAELGYSGAKRYCRISVTGSGATVGANFGAVAVLTGGRKPNVR